jgi:hypothetical protein
LTNCPRATTYWGVGLGGHNSWLSTANLSDTQTRGGKHASKEKGCKEEEVATEHLQVSSLLESQPGAEELGVRLGESTERRDASLRKILASVLTISLLRAESLLAQQKSGPTSNGQGTTPGATESSAPVSSGSRKSYGAQHRSAARPRSYERETRHRHHSRISKSGFPE